MNLNVLDLSLMFDINTWTNFSSLSVGELVTLSTQLIILAIIIVLVAVLIQLFANRKSKEQKIAKKMLSKVDKIRSGKVEVKPTTPQKKEKETKAYESLENSNKKEVAEKESVIKPDELSLKQMLINKFKPIVEKQLQTKIEIKNFKSQGANFSTDIMVQGHELSLILDSSGKIIDYKRKD
jgi:hypothetical protein